MRITAACEKKYFLSKCALITLGKNKNPIDTSNVHSKINKKPSHS